MREHHQLLASYEGMKGRIQHTSDEAAHHVAALKEGAAELERARQAFYNEIHGLA